MERIKKLCPETMCFVDALQSLMIAIDKCLEAFCTTYGETQGQELFKESGLEASFDAVKDKMHQQVGLSIELEMAGCLSSPKCV